MHQSYPFLSHRLTNPSLIYFSLQLDTALSPSSQLQDPCRAVLSFEEYNLEMVKKSEEKDRLDWARPWPFYYLTPLVWD